MTENGEKIQKHLEKLQDEILLGFKTIHKSKMKNQHFDKKFGNTATGGLAQSLMHWVWPQNIR